MIQRLKRYFWTPDSFEADPRGFARNQAGHFAIAFAGIWLGLSWWPLLLTWPCVLFAWEAGQYFLAGASSHDALEDTGFFAAGALAVFWWPVAAIAALFLAAGIARRFKPH